MWGKDSGIAGFVAKGVSRDTGTEKTGRMVGSPGHLKPRLRQ